MHNGKLHTQMQQSQVTRNHQRTLNTENWTLNTRVKIKRKRAKTNIKRSFYIVFSSLNAIYDPAELPIYWKWWSERETQPFSQSEGTTTKWQKRKEKKWKEYKINIRITTKISCWYETILFSSHSIFFYFRFYFYFFFFEKEIYVYYTYFVRAFCCYWLSDRFWLA